MTRHACRFLQTVLYFIEPTNKNFEEHENVKEREIPSETNRLIWLLGLGVACMRGTEQAALLLVISERCSEIILVVPSCYQEMNVFFLFSPPPQTNSICRPTLSRRSLAGFNSLNVTRKNFFFQVRRLRRGIFLFSLFLSFF